MTEMVTIENVIHLDVSTPDCICPRLPCGGVEVVHVRCSEHGMNASPLQSIHSHNRRILKESRLQGY